MNHMPKHKGCVHKELTLKQCGELEAPILHVVTNLHITYSQPSVSMVTLNSQIQSWELFIHDMKYLSWFFFFQKNIQCAQYYLLKISFHPLNRLSTFLENELNINSKVYF